MDEEALGSPWNRCSSLGSLAAGGALSHRLEPAGRLFVQEKQTNGSWKSQISSYPCSQINPVHSSGDQIDIDFCSVKCRSHLFCMKILIASGFKFHLTIEIRANFLRALKTVGRNVRSVKRQQLFLMMRISLFENLAVLFLVENNELAAALAGTCFDFAFQWNSNLIGGELSIAKCFETWNWSFVLF